MTSSIASVPSRIWPESDTEWLQVFNEREALAAGDRSGQHAFLFHLDWNTEPNLMRAAAAAIPPRRAPINEREWWSAAEALQARLRARWFNRAAPAAPGLPDGLVERISAIVRRGVELFPQPAFDQKVDAARAAIRRFGAGELRTTVSFGTPARPGNAIASDPDSYYIWFFTEFGLLARDRGKDADMWNRLLPDLILAGLFYTFRLTVSRSLMGGSLPGNRLDAKQMSDAEQILDTEQKKTGAIEQVFRACMRARSSSFR